MFKQVFLANVKEYIRDKTALFWFVAFPLVFVFIFGWVFSGSSEPGFNIGLIINSESELTEQMVEGFKAVDSFNVYVDGGDGSSEMEALKNGERHLVIELPELNLQQVFGEGNSLEIPVYYDASKQQTSQVLLSVINQMFNEAENKITGAPRIFELNHQPIQAERLTDFDYILPGILAMALMQLGLFGALQFLSLREQKIIRGLGVTPLTRSSILGSEILLRLILALVQTTLIITVGRLVFGVTLASSFLHVFSLVILGSVTFISLGYFLISFVNTSEAGQGLIQVIQFPMMFLSGTFFPYEMMPSFIQPVVKFLPLTYLADGLRELMTGVTTGFDMKTNLLVLGSWLLVTMVLSIKFWKWE